MPGWELFDEAEKKSVAEVMDTGILMRYGFDAARKGVCKARQFEELLSRTTGARHTLLLANGTAALTTALAALGIGAGDEVIMPTFTFVATFESVLAAGAVPVMADIDESLCLSPEAVEKAITPRTKAIIPVHMCGASSKMDELLAIAARHKLKLLEDSCQAFGAKYKGKWLGTIGDAGCYSFDFNKICTCGEGGAVLTNDLDTYKRADMYHDHGHDHTNPDRGAEGHPFGGFNYRISELGAAVGLAQLGKIHKAVEIHRRHKAALRDAIADACPGLQWRELADAAGDSATFLTFFAPTEAIASDCVKKLSAAGVDGSFHWWANNWHYIQNWWHFKKKDYANRLPDSLMAAMPDYGKADYSASDALMKRCVSVPIRMNWTPAELSRRALAAAQAIKEAEA